MEKIILRTISIMLFIAYAAIFKGCSDYHETKRVECVVLNKLESAGKNHSNYYLILQETTGEKRTFDAYVSPLDYSQSQIGKTYLMNFRDMDIHQTPMKNVLYFFLPVVLIIIAPVLLIASFLKVK